MTSDDGRSEPGSDDEAQVEGDLSAGAAKVDVTPDLGRGMIGYVRPDIRANGVHSRLYARALVLENDGSKLALVSADMLYGVDKDAVVDRIRDLGFSDDNVVYSGTHTHAAPDASTWTVERVAETVRRADEALKPARAAWGESSVSDVSRNRSVEAHLANHGEDIAPGEGEPELDPLGADHTVDGSVKLLRVEDIEGRPVAAWTRFSVHPTCLPPDNRLYSADLAGAAAHYFRSQLGGDRAPEEDERRMEPVVLFANGGEGDQIPRYEGCNRYAVADSLGRRLAEGYGEAWERAETALASDVELAATSREVEYRGQEVEDGKKVASRPVFGVPFLGGAENGPSFFYGFGLEGRRRPARLAGDVHGRKIPVAPAHWGPEVEVQVARVGEVALLGVPGEPTVEMARRSSEQALEESADDVEDAAVLGVTNGYNGYFTTPEEYDQQHYEGGHTVFGKHSAALVRTTHSELVHELRQREPSTEAEEGVEGSGGSGSVGDAAVEPPVGGASSGEITTQPPEEVARFSVLEFAWDGGAKGRDRPVDGPFVALERRADGAWVSVASDLDPGFVWTCSGGSYRARYDVPADLEAGTYRLRVKASGYDVVTDEIEVGVCRRLRWLGLESVNDGSLLVFHAQNPPPDPDTALRSRDVVPSGGEVEFALDDESYVAGYDEELGRWTAELKSVDDGDVLRGCRLIDGAGNISGSPVDLEVGLVDDVDWPPDMEVGGGKPPGPFGFGTWPI